MVVVVVVLLTHNGACVAIIESPRRRHSNELSPGLTSQAANLITELCLNFSYATAPVFVTEPGCWCEQQQQRRPR